MVKVVTVEQMRTIEAAADAAGVSYDTMMQHAGHAVAERVLAFLPAEGETRVTILVGPGNNGGDGLVAGRIIAERSQAQVRFYLLQPRDEDDPHYKAVRDAELLIVNAQEDQGQRVLRNMVGTTDILLDALFGIGARLPVKGDAEKLLRTIHQTLSAAEAPPAEGVIVTPAEPKPSSRRSAPYIVAVDCPSGLDCNTGELDKNALLADETVTFIGAKPGLFIFPGAAAVGQLSVATLGVPDDLELLQQAQWTLVDGKMVSEMLPARPADAHKGTFGKTLVIAGSANYIGAPGLAALAAYRVGVGLVTVGAPLTIVPTLAAHVTEATWLLLPHDMGVLSTLAADIILKEVANYDSLLVGPGWGREDTTREMLLKLLKQPEEAVKRARRPMGFVGTATGDNGDEANAKLPPLVIDADALNLLSDVQQWWTRLPENTILTPHPGEMARLAGIDNADVQAKRWELAQSKAVEWKVILVLKGAHTLIAVPDGRLAVLPFKTDALATAGTGDVLAGAIAGLLAQGMSPYEAAIAGSYLHGLAGQQAAEWQGNSRSVIARDVLDALIDAVALVDKR